MNYWGRCGRCVTSEGSGARASHLFVAASIACLVFELSKSMFGAHLMDFKNDYKMHKEMKQEVWWVQFLMKYGLLCIFYKTQEWHVCICSTYHVENWIGLCNSYRLAWSLTEQHYRLCMWIYQVAIHNYISIQHFILNCTKVL